MPESKPLRRRFAVADENRGLFVHLTEDGLLVDELPIEVKRGDEPSS